MEGEWRPSEWRRVPYRVADGAIAMKPPLTEREWEVMRMRAKGLTTGEIAAQLFIAEQTVKNHIQNAYRKARVRSVTEFYRAVGWLKVP